MPRNRQRGGAARSLLREESRGRDALRMQSLPTPDESVYDELGALLELPEGASYKEFARRIRRLYTSWEALNWIRVRFRRGDYPALSEYLSGLTNEEEETFFRTGGLLSVLPLEERTAKPWDHDPYDGDSEWYRNDLHDGLYVSGDPQDLRGLAVEWLEELTRVGYQGIILYHYPDGVSARLPAKQKTSSEAIPQPLRMSAKAGPVLFNDGRQVLWLELEVGRSERGHREIKLNDEPLRTDAAILASLVAMECRSVNLDRLHELLSALPSPMEKPFRKQGFSTDVQAWREAVPHPRTLDLAMMLLRFHKPYFDRLSEAEQIELLERACGHLNEFLSALRRVMSFLDYGAPGRQLRSAKGEAEKHIEAAVLKHVYGLSTMEIARQMGEPIAQKQKNKNDPATVRQWVRRGTQLMENAMGKERWRAQVEAMKAEAERWNNLTEEEQEAEEFLEYYAEARGISLDVARELVNQGYYPPDLSSLQRIRLENAIEARQDLEESRARPNDQHGATEV
jgi:hypothetical protein